MVAMINNYECDMCKKVYKTEKEAIICENKCKDICDFKIQITTIHNKDIIELAFNYETWEETFKEKDIFYVDCENITLTYKEINELITSLKHLRNEYDKKVRSK